MAGHSRGVPKTTARRVWQHRAKHLVASKIELVPPLTTISYGGQFGEDAAHSIYIFDQEMARLGVRYFAEYEGCRMRSARFKIYVSSEKADVVARVAAGLRKL